MDSIILTENLTKRFGDFTAVDNVSLDIKPGEIFGFLGPNGAGKTTTIGMLLGLIRPTSGRAIVLGHDVQTAATAALRSVGAMIEAPSFYPYLSGRDNLRVLAYASNVSESRIDDVLAMVDLRDRAKSRFKTYSQGMRQRLGVAAALLHEPQLIILDEPTNGLDPAGQQEMRDLVCSLAEKGHTIFFSSHQLHEVEQICKRVAILKEGKIVTQGQVADLLQHDDGVMVQVGNDIDKAESLLVSIDWITRVERRDGYLFVYTDGDRIGEINTFLITNAITVREIRVHKERLEDFFLEITGESLPHTQSS